MLPSWNSLHTLLVARAVLLWHGASYPMLRCSSLARHRILYGRTLPCVLDSQGQLQPVGKRRKQPLPTAHPESRTQWMRVCISCGHAKVKTQDQHWDSLW